MATSYKRRLETKEVRRFGSGSIYMSPPDLTTIQTHSYTKFLQEEVDPDSRDHEIGIESVLREIFPIQSYDGTVQLDYVRYELGKPRYTPQECKQLRLTYGLPFRIWLRLNKEEPIEEEVYLGDMPVMLGGGEFIINGAERVVVSQLHRSPGVDFVEEAETTSDRRLPSCRIIPERGSWIEINITKKDSFTVRIDQSGKFAATTLLRAMDPALSEDAALIRAFYETTVVQVKDGRSITKIEGKIAVDDIVYPIDSDRGGEIIVEAGQKISRNTAELICSVGLTEPVEVMEPPKNSIIFNTLAEDNTSSHEEALLRIYQRLRPGNPPQLEKAKTLFDEKFYDDNRYRLGRVGRFRMNRKLGIEVNEGEQTLRPSDLINSIKYVMSILDGDGTARKDDIDHLGNRRLRTIDELACDELRKGFLKLRRTVQERMSLKDAEDMTPRNLINPKSISAAIEYFFGRGELSQVVDQTNPLSMLTHERRLSALGPGGLNRKRAGFEVRDVHISHYGRICPIETPEGTNIGLISSLAIYSAVDEYGFLITPYRVIRDGKIADEIVWLRADEESDAFVAPADTPTDPSGSLLGDLIIARYRSDFEMVDPSTVQYIDVAPCQMVGVSASLIPFLEHDDANRALMGSNMQRQAVPLLIAEPPIVGTGLETEVARNSSMMIRAKRSGVIEYVDAERIVVKTTEGRTDNYVLRKFVGLNERTCLNQRPIIAMGQEVEVGTVLADGAATHDGQLALGRNVLVGFMSFDGYNYEDAIILSEELVKQDVYTSLHIEEFDVEIRETKLGREDFTRDIPNVSEKMLRNLDEGGVVQIGTYVKPGDILVGKVSPKSKTELTPEEKLLHAIFGRAGEDVKNDSLEVPSGIEGIVIHTEKFARRMSLSDDERKAFEKRLKEVETEGNAKIAEAFTAMIGEFEKILGKALTDDDGTPLTQDQDPKFIAEQAQQFRLKKILEHLRSEERIQQIRESYATSWPLVEAALDVRDRLLNSMKRGDELRSGVLQMVKVYIATKRCISVGDKMAGRHGNKGVIAKILPVEDMPFLPDGTPIQIMLNPLGVPSRMNVGQILETHLGWAGAKLGFQSITPVFDGASEEDINNCLEEAGLPRHGKIRLTDGRTGEIMHQETTVGYIYMLKLHHLVDDKVHARSTGPYSLITQQPLGGKARFGGQRFGEMEVWALEAYGAAYILQELLTVKSDDVEGRTKIYEAMVKGENTLEAGTPASFDVLTNEIRGLGLNMQLEKRRM
ncbi:DNA-directed RNA polymerase subunit beta [Blastopirellula marina]|uniref:DNA-directed RNA polymerase subunit beta n=1 Tax=Blastopirellula marina TaxID=124 RepID=A0A2S8GUE3_9BACT|nr:DNA-directed RNA polymerase subunit beta [Blastopirellula marina]PQO35521.1 DNA-directed RNA polymerase subunit beta [Blastopirellula marina]PQO48030.1 DNA-directed RNA polymerase subunit beta [Blastopirellula marina]PTL44160.1 DNA-directed RNA polymerase subunit beta [Blastopirellula marina]